MVIFHHLHPHNHNMSHSTEPTEIFPIRDNCCTEPRSDGRHVRCAGAGAGETFIVQCRVVWERCYGDAIVLVYICLILLMKKKIVELPKEQADIPTSYSSIKLTYLFYFALTATGNSGQDSSD